MFTIRPDSKRPAANPLAQSRMLDVTSTPDQCKCKCHPVRFVPRQSLPEVSPQLERSAAHGALPNLVSFCAERTIRGEAALKRWAGPAPTALAG